MDKKLLQSELKQRRIWLLITRDKERFGLCIEIQHPYSLSKGFIVAWNYLEPVATKKVFLLLQSCPPLCLEDFDSNPQVLNRKGFPLPLEMNGDKYPRGYSNSLRQYQCQAWQQGVAIPSQNTALESNQPGNLQWHSFTVV